MDSRSEVKELPGVAPRPGHPRAGPAGGPSRDQPHRAGHRLRAAPPCHHLGDHRPPHHGPPRIAADRRRGQAHRRRARRHRHHRGPRRHAQPRRRRLGTPALAPAGIDVSTRELLTFAILISLGGADPQAKGHAAANFNVGNTRQQLLDVITVLVPFIGYPRSLNSLAAVNEASKREHPAERCSGG